MSLVLPLLIFSSIFSNVFSLSTQRDTLTLNNPLAYGDTLVSEGKTFVLGFFSPPGSGNRYVGIWYNKVSLQTVVWVANRQAPITNSPGLLSITNTALEITGANNSIIWSLPVTGATNPIAKLSDNGNFVIKESGSAGDAFLWQSFDCPTDTLLPGMKLGWNRRASFNRMLTAWKSTTDPSPGNFSHFVDIQGDPQGVLADGSNWIWRGGPWDGVQFSGIPEMKTFSVFDYTFVNSPEEVYYTYLLVKESTISRLTVDYNGKLQRVVWLNDQQQWNQYWSWPKDQCDFMSTCGPFGVCDINNSPVCNCLPGFTPRSPEEWALRDGIKGCVRTTNLDCCNGTDGFTVMSKVKLPDTAKATVDMSLSLDECREGCLRNCSCIAYAVANISGTGSGCRFWTTDLTDLRIYTDRGQDLYVRLAASDLALIYSQKHKPKSAALVGSVSGVCAVLLLAFCGCFLWRKKKRKTVSSSLWGGRRGDADEIEVPMFDLKKILKATNKFSDQKKLGEGGFGPVYKGKLDGVGDIAVKRLSKHSVQGLDEFKNEVMVIARLQHRNLVSLQGYCIEGDERILIYEYMPNKSLDAYLFDKEKGRLLDWHARREIILGIARGILYLHQDSRLRVVHRDLKASNVLLDEELNPKISDFGIARIFRKDEIEASTGKVVGTVGYMSPEYAMDGTISTKADVFSFGVLLLEAISGKKNRGIFLCKPQLNLLGQVWTLWNEGKALEIVDESIKNTISEAEVMRFINVGLLCVQEDPEERPIISSVIRMLGSDDVLLPQPNKPGFVASKGVYRVLSSSFRQTTCILNDITTTLEGR